MNGFGLSPAALTAPVVRHPMVNGVLDALHRIFAAAGHRARRHQLFQDRFLEDSEMEREMHHL